MINVLILTEHVNNPALLSLFSDTDEFKCHVESCDTILYNLPAEWQHVPEKVDLRYISGSVHAAIADALTIPVLATSAEHYFDVKSIDLIVTTLAQGAGTRLVSAVAHDAGIPTVAFQTSIYETGVPWGAAQVFVWDESAKLTLTDAGVRAETVHVDGVLGASGDGSSSLYIPAEGVLVYTMPTAREYCGEVGADVFAIASWCVENNFYPVMHTPDPELQTALIQKGYFVQEVLTLSLMERADVILSQDDYGTTLAASVGVPVYSFCVNGVYSSDIPAPSIVSYGQLSKLSKGRVTKAMKVWAKKHAVLSTKSYIQKIQEVFISEK